MTISQAQQLISKHLKETGYDKIETEPYQAFIHLIEEIGEVARIMLHRETNRAKNH